MPLPFRSKFVRFEPGLWFGKHRVWLARRSARSPPAHSGARSACSRVFTVSDEARVQTPFSHPASSKQDRCRQATLACTATWSIEAALNRNASERLAYVDADTQSRAIADVSPPPPYVWRP